MSSDKWFYLYITLFIYIIFWKFTWAVFWIPKRNLCSKFLHKITFFILFGNAARNSWINKGSNFGTIYESTGNSWSKLDFIPCVLWILSYLKNVFHISRHWTQLNFENSKLKISTEDSCRWRKWILMKL